VTVSVFDLFKIGLGPSSSHTVGPMRAARMFTKAISDQGLLRQVTRVRAEMFGSLGATGKGHASDTAVILGFAGHEPDTVDVDRVPAMLAEIRAAGGLCLGGEHWVAFAEATDVVLNRMKTLPFHANGMRFTAHGGGQDAPLLDQTYYSVGGGFVVGEPGTALAPEDRRLPLRFHSAEELLRLARQHDCSIADVMRANERSWRSDEAIDDELLKIWRVMQACVARGCQTDGVLPGAFKVRRRAAALARRLGEAPANVEDSLAAIDWVNLYALAVNEENAAGGRVVTAPTNGAAGIIPAVLHFYMRFVAGADERGVIQFLLTAGAIGQLYKENASISGAEVGCQGEVGVACSMAAGGLCAVLGGTPSQVENAAEIGMEHHLGLTCDPVGGLVQIPCIERNALASVKAINAARMALHGDGTHHVSLDQVIKTMRETGADMMTKYKETSLGGLAVNIVEC
jgi:L-serine dehydratase